jgi:hypothetical protein
MVITLPIFLRFRALLGIALILSLLAIQLINTVSRPKESYNQNTGVITYFENQYGKLPYKGMGKYRYVKISGYSYPFELFVGKDPGDFRPKYENVDSLRIGDMITVYHYESSDAPDLGVNRNAQFVERDNRLFFERGASNRTIGIGILVVLGILVGWAYWMMKRGKLPY